MKVQLTDIPGVGRHTAEKLREAGFQTVESIAESRAVALEQVFGIGTAMAVTLHKKALAILERPAKAVSVATERDGRSGGKKPKKKGGKKNKKRGKKKSRKKSRKKSQKKSQSGKKKDREKKGDKKKSKKK
jgi:nucleotidyltransferase/DNA polymerase involved in DNA repair